MTSCACSEKKRPLPTALPEGSNERPRQWFVLRRNESASAFNGYRRQWSDKSYVQCRVCGRAWDTKAAYVADLPNCEYFPERVAPAVEPWTDQ
ncbi:hypothetical protein HOU02_gp277 [Caulobacter phage CcrBL9]|uniref:Uncharacterized protein n=1 Tax=Caulobacter phage CcrBL9 TaxID=2283270 RepID=A0A385EFA7_9CAUD|nr:hypothetical protein HOU02_gp277 [Caulobacter phage CcrBL9]AXQ69448.1 hypothetical protein CcrBL9_gp424 [Caulobacter phage CcrBL9]